MMNLHAMESRVGASAVARGSVDNPFDLVFSLIDRNPGLQKRELFELWREEISDAEEYRRAVEFYFFTNAYDSAKRPPRSQDPVKRAETAARIAEAVEKGITQVLMLNLEMPNGKQMRDCTGAEMAKFGNRYQKIAAKVGKAKLVGAVLNEDQVKAILK